MKSKTVKAKTSLPPATRLHKKKNKSKKKPVPKVGDPNYLTPTQLRNRRKRRAKQQQSSSNTSGSEIAHSTRDDRQVAKLSNKSETELKDPSMKYISNSKNTLIVKTAEQYVQSIQNNTQKSIDFQVHLGPIYEWRTVLSLLSVLQKKTKQMWLLVYFFLRVTNCSPCQIAKHIIHR
jgi:uncharacterized membrane protein YheB (UPF0754 family)